MLLEYLRNQKRIQTNDIATLFDTTERKVRDAMSKLSADKKNPVIFIPMRIPGQPGHYVRSDQCEPQLIVNYYNELRAHAKSIYFDRLLALKNHLDDEQKDELYAHLNLFKGGDDVDVLQ